MRKKQNIRLTESQLHNVISESVRQVLNELKTQTIQNYIDGRKRQSYKAWEDYNETLGDAEYDREGLEFEIEAYNNPKKYKKILTKDELNNAIDQYNDRYSKKLNDLEQKHYRYDNKLSRALDLYGDDEDVMSSGRMRAIKDIHRDRMNDPWYRNRNTNKYDIRKTLKRNLKPWNKMENI